MIEIVSDFRKTVTSMKRAISALTVCAAMLLALAGCRAASSSSSAQTGSTSSSTPDVSVSSSAAASTSSVPAKSVASGTAAARDEIDDGAFDDMMDALAGYQPGTSGASLKLYTAACGVLNFAEGYGDGQEQALRGALEQTLSSMDKAGREALADSFPDVDAAAREILENGVDSVSGVLADAGNPNLYDSYDAEKYEAVASVLTESLNANS